VVEELRGFYANEALRDDPALLRRKLPVRSLPSEAEEARALEVGVALDAKLTAALRLLFVPDVSGAADTTVGMPRSRRGCLQCHEVDGLSDGPISAKIVERAVVRGPGVPRVWFSHARFDHAAHRDLGCAVCHAGVGDSITATDVLLPPMEQCLECHSAGGDQAAGERGRSRSGAAGSSCTTCHRYHNGDHPLEGIGASSRGPKPRR
jgi:hypothetical protein